MEEGRVGLSLGLAWEGGGGGEWMGWRGERDEGRCVGVTESTQSEHTVTMYSIDRGRGDDCDVR
jgi:hypothetical protein